MKLYMDFLSQPSRAVFMTLKFLSIPFEIKEVRVSRLENRRPEFLAINALGTGRACINEHLVPVIEDDGFILTESHTIMKYLVKSRNIKTSL